MVVFGWIVISVIMACAVAGAIAACRDDEKGLGKEFLEGIYAIGYIFLPVAGIMASVPFLAALVEYWLAPLFHLIRADPALAATTLIATDMGGYQLAFKLKQSPEGWITAMTTGFMAGSTIVFSIPVGLAMLHKRDHKYMALGAMAGLLSIPIGVLVANLIILMLRPQVRPIVATDLPSGREMIDLEMSLSGILFNLAPLTTLMILLAVGLRLFPDLMIRLFMGFGRGMGILIKMVVVLSIVEYFTMATFKVGVFAYLFGWWGFDPIIVDAAQVQAESRPHGINDDSIVLRALEVAGYIGIMLAGAFPMVYLIRTYFAKPIENVGRRIGLDAAGAAGMLAAVANILAMFRLIKDMRARDKVLCIAFSVCAAFMFGDHLAFTTNFQPNLLLPVIVGKLVGGMCGFLLATWLCVPKALQLAEEDLIDKVRVVLQHVPTLKDKRPTSIVKVTGDFIYKVDCAGESYVVRLLGIERDRDGEDAVAAEVIAFLPAGSIAEIDDFQGAAVERLLG